MTGSMRMTGFNIKYKPSRPHVIDSTTTFLQLFYIWKWGMIAAGSVLVDTQTGGRHGALGTRGVLPDGTRVHVDLGSLEQ
jgi:hypothetical protein